MPTDASALLARQRSAGNQAVQWLLRRVGEQDTTALLEARRGFEERLRRRRLEATRDIVFRRPAPGLRAEPNGPPLSPADYARARLTRDVAHRSSGEVIADRSSNAGEIVSEFSALMDQIKEDDRLVSTADLRMIYGSLLAKFKVGGLSMDDFVLQAWANASSRAAAETDAELRDPASALRAEAAALRRQGHRV